MRLTDRVREHSAAIAAAATSVRIVPDRLVALDPVPAGPPEPEHHFVDGSREDVARFVFCLTAINFGSGWWPTIRKRAGMSGYFTMSTGLTERFRAHGAWSNDELRRIGAAEIAEALGQDPGHDLMALYADALRQLGRWLGDRAVTKVVDDAGGSAERLAEEVASGMAYFDDRGFYKRAQILGPELERFEVTEFDDLRRLTLFADNLVPHVLRMDRALVYSDLLAARIDAGQPLPSGTWEREIRACAIQAVEQLATLTGAAPHELDMALWSHGQRPEYKAVPRHRHRTVFY
ncbi:MAG: queuosine salvage family protein [Solirubrobacteraceae bacterium]|nr:queuosine salvage family protein [Solirubrobacteraceae bacterium]